MRLFSTVRLAIPLSFLLLAQIGAQPAPKAIPAKGMENVFQLSERLYSGSAPGGEEGFAQLRKLGIKTIISVDGSKPDVALAHKHGLHYVHLPHGYDGISTHVQGQLVKAAQVGEGSIFVHCHHGKHRGPAAAAVICMAENGWSAAQAETWMKAAGTATNYTGLYETVRRFHAPSAETLAKLPASFPEVAKVSELIDAMVAIDEQWDLLKAMRKTGYQAPKGHPDIQPVNEIVILWEHFCEAQRLSESVQRGNSFIERLKSAESSAKEGEQLLRQHAASPTPALREQLDRNFDAMNQSCLACHKVHRDRTK